VAADPEVLAERTQAARPKFGGTNPRGADPTLTEQTHGAQALKGLAHFARVMPQFVVIDEVLVTERNPENPLPNQRRSKMLDPFRAPPTDEALGKPERPGRVARSTAPNRSAPASETRRQLPPEPCSLHGCKINRFLGAPSLTGGFHAFEGLHRPARRLGW
jgi:hypothetical protein